MAYIDTQAPTPVFPENRIITLDERELVCYPKATTEDVAPLSDKLTLDTTGEYLVIGKQKKKKKKKAPQQQQEELPDPEKELFLQNAFLLFRNADRILNDSRMFLAPVPIQSGLAYTGTSGFMKPTLGVYIEWWQNCKVDVTKDLDGEDALTYHLAGSPLSGSNRCACVYPDGKSCTIVHPSFMPLWTTFIAVNRRYTEAKFKYEAYSLQEVVDILKSN